MPLETNQEQIQLSTLYKVDAMSKNDIQRDLNASIWIDSGSVDIYGSDSATQPASLAEMTLNANDTAVEGKRSFDSLTNYITVVQNTGTSTEVVISGVSVTDDLGAIS